MCVNGCLFTCLCVMYICVCVNECVCGCVRERRWVDINVCVCRCMYVYACVYDNIYVYCVRAHLFVCTCGCMNICVWVHVFGCVLHRLRTHSCDPNSETRVRICVHYGPDRLVIQRLAHKMIWRSVPIRSVKTKQRFGPKIASFHVSVYFYIITHYRYLLINYYHVQILVVYVNYYSWLGSLRWHLYQSSNVWDWNVLDILSTGCWVSYSAVDT